MIIKRWTGRCNDFDRILLPRYRRGRQRFNKIHLINERRCQFAARCGIQFPVPAEHHATNPNLPLGFTAGIFFAPVINKSLSNGVGVIAVVGYPLPQVRINPRRAAAVPHWAAVSIDAPPHDAPTRFGYNARYETKARRMEHGCWIYDRRNCGHCRFCRAPIGWRRTSLVAVRRRRRAVFRVGNGYPVAGSTGVTPCALPPRLSLDGI